jgi:hypothetical protein
MDTNNTKLSDLTLKDLETFLDKERNKKGKFQKDLESSLNLYIKIALGWGILCASFIIYGAYFH